MQSHLSTQQLGGGAKQKKRGSGGPGGSGGPNSAFYSLPGQVNFGAQSVNPSSRVPLPHTPSKQTRKQKNQKQIRAHLHMRTLVGVRLPLPGERVLVLDFAERVTDASRPTHRVGVGFGLVVMFRDLGVFGGDVWVGGWWLVMGVGASFICLLTSVLPNPTGADLRGGDGPPLQHHARGLRRRRQRGRGGGARLRVPGKCLL